MPRVRRARSTVAASALAAWLLVGATPARARGPEWGAEAVRASAAGANAFAVELFRTIGSTAGNACISPYGLSTLLTIVRAGGRGETARQMGTTLHLPSDEEAILAFLPQVRSPRVVSAAAAGGSGVGQTRAYTLDDANGVFPAVRLPIEPAFRRLVGERFGAELRSLDYEAGDAARKTINEWVRAKSGGLIDSVVPEGLPRPDTTLTVVNSIRFKAQWTRAFRPVENGAGKFAVAGGGFISVPMMQDGRVCRLGEIDDASLLEIPYLGGDSSMIVLLPKERDGLDAVVKALTADRLRRAVEGMSARLVAIQIPKFAFTCERELSRALRSLGMTDAFESAKADFSGISKQGPAMLTAVLHKVRIDVDENGTEAAAATVAVISRGEGPGGAEPAWFSADHPFLFLIRHVETGVFLFLGRVDDPSAR